MADKAESDLAGMREEYKRGVLHRKDLNPDPFQQFRQWFDEAREAGLPEPNAMTLSTLGLDQMPSSRTVLLKDLDNEGFTFFTNYKSRKARELAAHPQAALLFLWKEQARQVCVQGEVEVVSTEESEIYFNSRPYDSRIGAWVSEQSQVIPERKWLETRDSEMRKQFPDTGAAKCVPRPENWGGYRVLPSRIEFWQGGAARLHDRFLYVRDLKNAWKIERLSP